MRPVLPDDLDVCARALLGMKRGQWGGWMAEVLAQADTADRFRKRMRRIHAFGDGSLKSAVLRHVDPSAPGHCNAAYCDALSTVLEQIALWRDRHSRR